MIDIAPQQLPDLIRWFPSGSPGLGAFAEHVLPTSTGHWWAPTTPTGPASSPSPARTTC
ncbi:hypothetical protein ACFY0G_24165 [Streptomyces sp. NPDC001552]|uniref:hypothetical protein n=1 Tax=Streptomyces sp. NPDC001552 TaxID=3364587 RepID=UPI0036BB6D16